MVTLSVPNSFSTRRFHHLIRQPKQTNQSWHHVAAIYILNLDGALSLLFLCITDSPRDLSKMLAFGFVLSLLALFPQAHGIKCVMYLTG